MKPLSIFLCSFWLSDWLEDWEPMEKSLGSNIGKSVGWRSCETRPPFENWLFSNPRIVVLVSRLLIGVNGSIIIKDII
jgi:hypothetical protein